MGDVHFLNEAELKVPEYLVKNIGLHVRKYVNGQPVVSVDAIPLILDYYARINCSWKIWFTDFAYVEIFVRNNILTMSKEVIYTVDWLSWPRAKRREWMEYWKPFITARIDVLQRRLRLKKWKRKWKYLDTLLPMLKIHTPDRIARKIILLAPEVAQEVKKQLEEREG